MNISVIIPTYNRVDVLQRALQSVVEQTYPATEIIVVDDGSTDNSAEMVNDLFPQVRYFKQDNHGVSHARNQGIKKAKGDWLAFLDSDDTWLPNKLASQVGALNDQPDFKICHTEEIWIRNGVRVNAMNKHKKIGGWIFQHCLPLCAMSPSSIMMHHSVLDNVGDFDESLPACEDYDLWLRLTANYPVLFLEEPLINKYGGHEDQLSHQYWGMDRFRIQALDNILKSANLGDENKQAATLMLLKKATLFMKGAAKRNKLESVQFYSDLIARITHD